MSLRFRYVVTMYEVPLPAVVSVTVAGHQTPNGTAFVLDNPQEDVAARARRIALFHFSAHPADAIGVILDRRVIGPQLALFERNRSIDMEGAL